MTLLRSLTAKPEGSPPTFQETVYDLAGVARTYEGPPPVHALQPTNLAIRAGEYVTITGPSGSGKSTLMNVLGLLDRPTAGALHFCGHNMSTLPERERTALRGRQIGFVFQSFHLLGYRTAHENVALAQTYIGTAPAVRRAAAAVALEKVGLAHRLHALPPTMSGGERQRVAIARALVNDPAVVLCDEPTGNLDSRSATAVLSLIDELHARGMTIVVVTHDPSVAERGQRLLRTKDGTVTEVQP